MVVQIDIPDDAIKQEDIENEDILNAIESSVYYMFRVVGNYHIEDSKIKFSIL